MTIQSFDEIHKLSSQQSDVVELENIYIDLEKEILMLNNEKKKKRVLLGIGSLFLLGIMLTNYFSRVFANMNNKTSKWASNAIANNYRNGVSITNDAFKKKSAATINNEAINKLVEETDRKLTDANGYALKNVKDIVKSAIAEAIKNGDDVSKAYTVIVDKLISDGVKSIRDKRGREMNLPAYARMIARTETMNAHNQGTIDRCVELGHDLVLMSSHSTSCPVCVVYQGRVYSISGRDSRFPKLDLPFCGITMLIHPNCRHYLISYMGNAESQIDNSNRPFVIRLQDQKIINRYNRIQARKRKLRRV